MSNDKTNDSPQPMPTGNDIGKLMHEIDELESQLHNSYKRMNRRIEEQKNIPCPLQPRYSKGKQHSHQNGEEKGKHNNSIPLPALSLQDPLRSKWRLLIDLPAVGSLPADQASPRCESNSAMNSQRHIRLFGIISSGAAWERKIALRTIAQKGSITIGRDPALADIVLPGDGISRMHAQLEYSAGGIVISDIGSTNGIYINDRALNRFESHVALHDGSILCLGETLLRVEYI